MNSNVYGVVAIIAGGYLCYVAYQGTGLVDTTTNLLAKAKTGLIPGPGGFSSAPKPGDQAPDPYAPTGGPTLSTHRPDETYSQN